jgi:hypothetical protein
MEGNGCSLDKILWVVIHLRSDREVKCDVH